MVPTSLRPREHPPSRLPTCVKSEPPGGPGSKASTPGPHGAPKRLWPLPRGAGAGEPCSGSLAPFLRARGALGPTPIGFHS